MSEIVQPEGKTALERFNEELDLVDLIARQVFRSVRGYVEFDDLLSAGREGLLDASRRFDPSRGLMFKTFASPRIRGAMVDRVRNVASLPRRAFERLVAVDAASRIDEGEYEFTLANGDMTPAEADDTLDNQLALAATACALGIVGQTVTPHVDASVETTVETPEEQVARAELLHHLREAIDSLKEEREAEVLRLHYFEGMTIEAIGVEVGADKSWVSRLHRRAMDRLARRMRNLL
jgi:RNA polymerase sigma factor FliA